jgi:hypothetical protein
VATHPDYRAVAGLHRSSRARVPARRARCQESVDLAAAEGERLVLLDVKIPRATPRRQHKVEQYRPQRDVCTAVEGISGLPVHRFAYQFSRAGVQLVDRIGQAERDSIAAALAQRVARMEEGRPRLTDHPAECRFCGYRRVRWCPGVGGEGGGIESVR